MANDAQSRLIAANDNKFSCLHAESETNTQSLLMALESFFSIPQTPEDFVKVIQELAYLIVRCEPSVENLAEERKLFNQLRDAQLSSCRLGSAASKFIFTYWVAKSHNSFAKTFRLGKMAMKVVASSTLQKRGTKGRKLIGARSRTKVVKAAENFRSLPKYKAATEIASIVNLSSEKVRSYLSELFPGDSWKL